VTRDAGFLAAFAAGGEGADDGALLGGKYRLEQEIGRGGMGVVYRARRVADGAAVAVKLLDADLDPARASELGLRLEREALVLRRLAHEGIVRLLDAGADEEGRPFLVMELVNGRPLSRLLPLAPRRALEVARDVSRALAAAHAAGVVHRDVKPANILLDDRGRAKVLDFGIARAVRGDATPGDATATPALPPTLTGAGRVAGTERYMAPEAREGARPAPAQDIYALGVVLYEAATGRPPALDRAPSPEVVEAVVRRAIAADPARRFASADEMARALEAAIASLDALEAGALPPEERLFARAAALVLSVATALALWAFVECVRPRILAPGEAHPLLMLAPEALPDGRLLVRARFETGPVLAALGAGAVAAVALGVLLGRWRRLGLAPSSGDIIAAATPASGRAGEGRPPGGLPESRAVLLAGGVALAVYGARILVDRSPLGDAALVRAARPYVPILGGAIEVLVLVLAWTALLEALRRDRDLSRERALWGGLALAVAPPALELLAAAARGAP